MIQSLCVTCGSPFHAAATCTELRPPPQHDRHTWHWLSFEGTTPEPYEWRGHGPGWNCNGATLVLETPRYRYIGPVEWRQKECAAVTADLESSPGGKTISPYATILRLRQHIAGLERTITATQKLAAARADDIEMLKTAVTYYEKIVAELRAKASSLPDETAALEAASPSPMPETQTAVAERGGFPLNALRHSPANR